MAGERISMRIIRQVLRLAWEAHLSQEQVARACRVSKGAVNKHLQRATQAGLSWPLPEGMDDAALEKLLSPSVPAHPPKFAPPEYSTLTVELRRTKGVTLWLLWEEYRQAHGKASYSYAQFCHLVRVWQKKQQLSMRQTHKAGEKLFSDFSNYVHYASGQKQNV